MTDNRLVERLAEIGPLAVAFSGGADSALVLAAAVLAAGPEAVLAVTANSASLAAAELQHAENFARTLGVRHLAPATTELDNPRYAANGRDRCYFCKSTVLDTITAVAREHGIKAVATGTNADDARDPHRPGIRAGDEIGVHTPLRDLGMTKADVRAMSRRWGLSTWDKPALPCLASRVRYGLEITPARLARVERAEVAVRAWLAEAGTPSRDVRVRDLGGEARVELDPHLVGQEIRAALAEVVRAAGFTSVDLKEFRSGALNHEQPVEQVVPAGFDPLQRHAVVADEMVDQHDVH
ncbi:ATP-dependent sacrificial sulfur transferase LarE [Lentzea sp. NPDC005914]|uniref:ATP-dependent sacrificial sulfur transferase LarE n=1 Tax=Lentzea sp. NPDC005914 TaxID=3154572 RepID=UPI00340BAF42